MNAHVRTDMVNRVFDPAYVHAVFTELGTWLRVAGLTPAARDEIEREAVTAWMGGRGARQTAARLAVALGAAP